MKPNHPLELTAPRAGARFAVAQLERSTVPPLEHAEGAKCVPATGGADFFHLEKNCARVTILQKPASVGLSPFADDLDSLLQAIIAFSVAVPEIVERPEDVVVPPGRKREPRPRRLDHCAGAVRTEQPVTQQEFPAARLGCANQLL